MFFMRMVLSRKQSIVVSSDLASSSNQKTGAYRSENIEPNKYYTRLLGTISKVTPRVLSWWANAERANWALFTEHGNILKSLRLYWCLKEPWERNHKVLEIYHDSDKCYGLVEGEVWNEHRFIEISRKGTILEETWRLDTWVGLI